MTFVSRQSPFEIFFASPGVVEQQQRFTRGMPTTPSKAPKAPGYVATREDEGRNHARWVLPLMFICSGALVVWSLSKSNSIPPLEHQRGRREPPPNLWGQTPKKVWEAEGWDVPPSSGTCRQTKFQPFKTGCPISCCGYRGGSESIHAMQQPMYRFALMYDFGRLFPEMHDYDALSENLSDADLEKKLNVSAAVARIFAKSESTLAGNASPALKPKVQNFMHLTVSYFCCMTETEAKRIATLVRDYVASAKTLAAKLNHLAFRVARVECWRERLDSVMNILLLDNSTQRKLLAIHDDVTTYLSTRAQGTTVGRVLDAMPTRQEQMPFHVTLLGLSAPREAGTFQPGNVSRYVSSIARAVDVVNHNVADLYADSKATSPLHAIDLRTSTIQCHANCDLDHS